MIGLRFTLNIQKNIVYYYCYLLKMTLYMFVEIRCRYHH